MLKEVIMKKKKFLLLITLLSFLATDKVYAACTENEINKFNQDGSTYKVTTDFDPTTKQYVVTYYMENLQDYNISFSMTPGATCQIVDNNTLRCTGSNLNGDYEMTISGDSNTCSDELKKDSGTIPKYNEHYGSEECQGIEDFALCQKDYTKDVTEEEFKSRVETYKKTNEQSKDNSTDNKTENKTDDNKTEIKNDTIIDKVIYYIQNNLTKVIVITIFVILLIVTTIITVKSVKKSRRLE